MNTQELYDLLENEYWLEPTENEDPIQNRKWLFNKPTIVHDKFFKPYILEGIFVLDYSRKGRPQRETGKYSIEISEGQAVIKITDAEFYLDMKDNNNVMVWRSKSGSTRALERLNKYTLAD
jgi:gentisate 1,2-dioxygenase